MKTLENKMPNGLTSWIETHHEIVSEISIMLAAVENNLPTRVMETRGTGGVYELGEELTDKFERINEDREWDGEFFDEITAFCKAEINPHNRHYKLNQKQ